MTDEGWLYLSSLEDLCTRKIVAFHMDERMTKSLVLKALDQAYRLQRPRRSILHHFDPRRNSLGLMCIIY
ncbi:DDE-type integrase/transposase/recombinase [Brevibacillus reuszeri]|uniref:DDE-type integrase/transposase/recombinase n=1 Tax=Brevibacillus reuszeri TaxID=54915 RepID=UPI0035E3C91A